MNFFEVVFQSTFPQGERPSRARYDQWESDVSIHVPARGTTRKGAGAMRRKRSFNPRSRKGNDMGWMETVLRRKRFNPRSRKGNDDFLRFTKLKASTFQSTFPQGERLRFLHINKKEVHVSIHVPARGTTSQKGKVKDMSYVSIHVPARGTTFILYFTV